MLPRIPLTVSATLTALAGATLFAPTAAEASATPLVAALEYLAAQQAPSGAVITGYGAGADIGTTEDTVIGVADAGYDPTTVRSSASRSLLDFLTANLSAETDNAKHTAKLVLAVVAAHDDPASFAGTDLVARLTSFYSAATGQFDAKPDVFSQSLGILATAAAGRTVPVKALSTLAAMQCSDGGFACPGGKGSSDTNSTAVALTALHCAGSASVHCTPVTSGDIAALAYLHGVQDSDGGFPFSAGSGSDPDSDALVIEGLLAAGQDPAAPAWTRGGNPPAANLRSFQAPSGGFAFPGNPAADAFTTGQPPAALAGKFYGAATSFATGAALPAAAAPTPAPTPRATPGGPVAPPLTGGGPTASGPVGGPATTGTGGGGTAPLGLAGPGAAVGLGLGTLAGLAVRYRLRRRRRPARGQPG